MPDAGMSYRLAPEPENDPEWVPMNEPVNEPVLYETLKNSKLEDRFAIEALKDAVAAFNSASVANVASKEELKSSKLVTLSDILEENGFNPTIPDEGMSYKSAPEPEKEPEKDPDRIMGDSSCLLLILDIY